MLDRLGGMPRLELLVDGLYDQMANSKELTSFFHLRGLAKLKQRTVDFLAGMWGGQSYRGPDLFFAHAGLGVSVRVYDLMMKFLHKQLKLMKVDKDLYKLIIADFEAMREPICDPTGKLAKVREAARRALDEELGDPFDSKANRQRYEENQLKEQERREKMAAFRKKRRQEQEAKKQAEAKQQQEAQAMKGPAKTVANEPKAIKKKVAPRIPLAVPLLCLTAVGKFVDEVNDSQEFSMNVLDDEVDTTFELTTGLETLVIASDDVSADDGTPRGPPQELVVTLPMSRIVHL